MKIASVFTVLVAALVLMVSFAAGADVAKGKALFNDPKFGNGTSGKSCATCHQPDAKDEKMSLRKAGSKKEFTIMGKQSKTLEEVVNICIEGPLKGKAIDTKSADMENIVGYIKSLKKKAIEGC